jgi:hypothetical protein
MLHFAGQFGDRDGRGVAADHDVRTVSITVELDPRADDPWLTDTCAVSLEAQLLNAAILDTPTPVDLPRTPLSRLGVENDTGTP